MKRRLAAILAADVAGYSRLMNDDEPGTFDRLKALRIELVQPNITNRSGRIVKVMGDGMLVEFSSVFDATQCAIDIQQQMADRDGDLAREQRISLRMGVNLGDLIVEGTDVYGEGVNVAARLEGLAEPGGICISGKVYDELKSQLSDVFEDLGERALKNIKEPVRIFRWVGKPAAATVGVANNDKVLPLPDKPSIAVLPFDNLSPDPEQEFFADGMTEDIITLLATVPELFVIARNSTFSYKNRAVDVRQVSKELGVRYVLEGSVRKAGNRIRVNGQFIDATTGGHIWANHYDCDLKDIFVIQDEVAQAIAGSLQSRLLIAESAHFSRRAPKKLDAWGNVVHAKLKLFAFRRQDIDAAEPYARRAIDFDPNYAEGHAVLSHVLAWRTWNGWSGDFKETAREALHHIEQALRLGANDPTVLVDVGFSLWWLGRLDEAVPHLQRAATLNPNSPITLAMHGYSLCAQGQPDEGLILCQKALRLSPKDPIEYLLLHLMGSGEFHAKKYIQARTTIEQSLQINPHFTHALTMLAAVCVKLGHLDEAKAALNRAEAISATAIPFLFRTRAKRVRWHEFTDPLREVYDGPLPR